MNVKNIMSGQKSMKLAKYGQDLQALQQDETANLSLIEGCH